MNSGYASSTSLFTDFAGLTSLKAQARQDQSAAIDKVASQFESMFLQMMLKTMRQASLAEDSIFNSQIMEKYRTMYDEQLSVHLSEAGGIGLATEIKRQLAGKQSPVSQNKSLQNYLESPVFTQPKYVRSQERVTKTETSVQDKAIDFDGTAETFVDKLKPYAQKAAALLGIQPEALLAQAALETGWGKSQMKMADGKPSFNLFGIKADSRWDGKQANVSTLEFRDGIAKKERANFRAYDSYEDSFNDYVNFIKENGRYRKAITKVDSPPAYFSAIQQAGYATDPDYAKKIISVMQKEEIANAYADKNQPVSEES
jgi:flagellar protein FlgJ